MNATTQIQSAQRTAAFQTFVARQGETFGPYDLPANGEPIVARVIETWGVDGLKSPDCYEIAFKQLVSEGKLAKNESYVASSIRAQIDSLPAAELGRRYRTDATFRKAFDDAASEDVANGRMSESDPYRFLTAEQYHAIPPIQRAELYARNAFFQRATQRLISEGKI